MIVSSAVPRRPRVSSIWPVKVIHLGQQVGEPAVLFLTAYSGSGIGGQCTWL
jgi:hypothetical protein